MPVDPVQVVLAAIAITVMIGVPLLCHFGFEALCGRYEERFSRWRTERSVGRRASRGQDVLAHRRNVRALRRTNGLPIERVAADLRRLRVLASQRAERSAVQQIGARMAYDQVLVQACAMFEIDHTLTEESTGMDREIERIRVEAALEDAGVVLIDSRFDQAA